jgi:glucose-1-phosphate adenylyltransferase
MKAVGIILAGGKGSTLGVLTQHRNLAAMPLGGSYRAIDFMLSSLSNSGIKKVAIMAQNNTRSLTDHLSSSKWWDLGRKKTGLFLFSPHMNSSDTFNFKGTADAIGQNIDFLKRSNEPYVVIVSGEHVAKIDFTKVIKYHEQKNADITVLYKDFGNQDLHEYGVIGLDDDGRMIDFEEKPFDPQYTTASIGCYVVGRELLIHLLEELEKEGRYDIVNDIIIRYRRKLNIYGYHYEGYWKTLKNVEEFYCINMDFLNPDVRKPLFNEYPPILTKEKDEPPSKYNENAHVSNSIVTGGDIINATVENSILFRKVFVGEGSYIRNSIVMEGVTIGRGVVVENAIIDKQAYISDGQRIIGTPDKITVVAKRSII